MNFESEYYNVKFVFVLQFSSDSLRLLSVENYFDRPEPNSDILVNSNNFPSFLLFGRREKIDQGYLFDLKKV